MLVKRLICAALFLAGIWTVPQWWCGRSAGAWYAGDERLQGGLARGVTAWLDSPLSRSSFSTGNSTFDGEWFFGTYMMAGMGFG